MKGKVEDELSFFCTFPFLNFVDHFKKGLLEVKLISTKFTFLVCTYIDFDSYLRH